MIEYSILVVDDDSELLESAEDLLASKFHVSTAGSVAAARTLLSRMQFDIIIADLNFEGQSEDGIDLLDYLSREAHDGEVIVLSGDQMTSRIVNAMKRNLSEFVPKEGEYSEVLLRAVAKAIEKKKLRDCKVADVDFLTDSPLVKRLVSTTRRLAASPGHFPILIQGETGTGKEVLAKFFAGLLSKKIVAANMASIPREMAESELFGHVKGSFTGAVANRVGQIEQANRGIFFLDEIGECSPAIQAKLLRVIQEREVSPVGANAARKIDVRFISATHRDLNEMVKTGEFREDLLQRLNTFVLKIPPLRERPEDVVLYATRFLAELDAGRQVSIDSGGIETLLRYSWPGNVRQLRNIIERSLILSTSGVINSDLLKEALDLEPERNVVKVEDEFTRHRVLEALEFESGNRARASARLGVHPSTVRRWIRKYGIGSAFAGTPGRPYSLESAQEKVAGESK